MKEHQKKALIYAFPFTIPVMVGYLFLGAAFGILMKNEGYGLGWIVAMSVFIFAGSLQFMGVNLLVSAVHPLYALLMALMINARHLFYGISMLEKYKSLKKFRPYLIFALTDETFSVLCSQEVPEYLDKNWVYFWIALLDHSYWVAGSVIGCLIGQVLTFNTKGLEFSLTALFVVIFVDQWKTQKSHFAALLGLAATAVCLIATGKDYFIIPAMLTIISILTIKYYKEAVS